MSGILSLKKLSLGLERRGPWRSLADRWARRVPQQKNDYDCGIFVLYFMERFIEEAPERLRKDDLDMFGRKWFKPEEASRLRGRIRELLKEEFDNPITVNNNGRESSPTSSGDGSPNCTEEEFDNPIIVSNINSRESSPTSSDLCSSVGSIGSNDGVMPVGLIPINQSIMEKLDLFLTEVEPKKELKEHGLERLRDIIELIEGIIFLPAGGHGGNTPSACTLE
ncbi:hypothetical protein IFM89_036013 [Coptis chinensis]|uniref:Ubiquitin-like protease family profile domain-containing protein n=1 Tax=Coptis chinensis TaxID=261450 RepID=A0A835MB17_9MAGN|nr:hypothetical protein IFM89_036013 [Coptis chinensis]